MTTQPQLDPDWIVCEMRAVAREARRIATNGATEEERHTYQERKRRLLDTINERTQP